MLSGNGDYVPLPSRHRQQVARLHHLCLGQPVRGHHWPRIFDFGTGTNDYMFMTPQRRRRRPPLRDHHQRERSGAATHRRRQLPLNTWSHVAVTLSGKTGTLYLNGTPVATNPNMTLHPAGLGTPTRTGSAARSFRTRPSTRGRRLQDLQPRAVRPRDRRAGRWPAGAGNVADVQVRRGLRPDGDRLLRQRQQRDDHQRRDRRSAGTPLWQPLPDGPITVPAGSTNVPVTSTSGSRSASRWRSATATRSTSRRSPRSAPPGAGLLSAAGGRRFDHPQGELHRDHHARRQDPAGHRVAERDGHRHGVGTAGPDGTGLTLTAPLHSRTRRTCRSATAAPA